MEVTIDGERTKLPDDDDLLIGEAELVAKHLDIDLGTSHATQKLMGLIFLAIHRKNPDGAIVDQVDAVRKMTIKSLDIKKEDAEADPLDVDTNGRSDRTPGVSGAPA